MFGNNSSRDESQGDDAIGVDNPYSFLDESQDPNLSAGLDSTENTFWGEEEADEDAIAEAAAGLFGSFLDGEADAADDSQDTIAIDPNPESILSELRDDEMSIESQEEAEAAPAVDVDLDETENSFWGGAHEGHAAAGADVAEAAAGLFGSFLGDEEDAADDLDADETMEAPSPDGVLELSIDESDDDSFLADDDGLSATFSDEETDFTAPLGSEVEGDLPDWGPAIPHTPEDDRPEVARNLLDAFNAVADRVDANEEIAYNVQIDEYLPSIALIMGALITQVS